MVREAILWIIWKERNKIIFHGEMVKVLEHWEVP
jgi:hypothetical protein